MQILKGSGQVEVASELGSIFLYTHDNATSLVQDVHTVLSRRIRWDDPDYLSRIIFCQMIPEEHWKGEKGYGIGSLMYADTNVYVRIDTVKSEIEIINMLTKEKKSFMLDTFVEDYFKDVEL